MRIDRSTTPRGIAVQTTDRDGRGFAAITFAVAARDESPQTRGVTLLLARVISERLQPRSAPGRAISDDSGVSFTVTGSVSECVEHLAAIAHEIATLESLTESELERARVREMVVGEAMPTEGSASLRARFGLRGVGLEALPPALASLTRDVVLEWAGRALVAENAMVSASATLPEGFDLVLPRCSDSAMIARGPTSTDLVDRPTAVGEYEDAPVLSILLDRTTGFVEYRILLEELFRHLVEERGLADHVDGFGVAVSDRQMLAQFRFSRAESWNPAGAAQVVEAFRALARKGISDETLSLVRGLQYDQISPAGPTLRVMCENASMELRGWSTYSDEEEAERAEAMTSASVVSALSTALPTLVAGWEAADDPEFLERTRLAADDDLLLRPVSDEEWPKTKGETTWSSVREKGVPRSSLRMTDGRILLSVAGTVFARDFDEIVLGRDGGHDLELFDNEGHTFVISAEEWTRGDSLVAAAREALANVIVSL